MLYKTICLELLQQCPELYDRLRSNRTLMPALDHYSNALKSHHETWMEHLLKEKPGGDQSQIASEALEIALQELEDSLPPGSPPNEDSPLSLEDAMAFLRMPPG
jgi:hypothetical protein